MILSIIIHTITEEIGIESKEPSGKNGGSAKINLKCFSRLQYDLIHLPISSH